MLTTSVTSLLILGTDAVLAGAPATPVQLAHACRRAGFDMVVPSSWGDELIAARALDRLGRATGPMIQVSCPVASRVLAPHADAIAPWLMCLVPPVVAVAEYLRALTAPTRAHITFVGNCPAGAHASMDAWLSPDEFLATLADRGIRAADEPTEFDSIIPPDRRRFFSDPGGTPCVTALERMDPPVRLAELGSDDFAIELAELLLADSRLLVNPTVGPGCSCRGAVPGLSVAAARARIVDLEPPRAASPVVDHGVPLVLDAPLPAVVSVTERGPSVPSTAPPPPVVPVRRRTPAPSTAVEDGAVATETRRRSPLSTPRPVLGSAPVTTRETSSGRRLPRAYVARRRSSPRGIARLTRSGAPQAQRPAWQWIALAGLGAGIGLAWLLGLAR